MSENTQEDHLKQASAHPAPADGTTHQESALGLQTGSNPVITTQDVSTESASGPVVDSATSAEPETKPSSGNLRPGFFAAGGSLMRKFDEVQSRRASRPSSPPPAIVGIGNKVAPPDYSEEKIVLAMVGLPARGKSYLSNKLTRYLKWLEYDVKVFNVGNLRRSKAKSRASRTGKKEVHSANFFSNENDEATKERETLAEESLEMLISWLYQGGNVAIHDATNSTKSRRAKIEARVSREPNFSLIFLESWCDDPEIIAANVDLKVSAGDPDYMNMSREEARKDFLARIKQYEAVYQTITEPHLSYMRIANVGSQVTVHRIHGYLQSRIAFYLMNLHLKPRSIFMSRHGESMYNVEGKIGGDAPLSPRGMLYANALPGLIKDNLGDANLTVWTSTLQRTIQTAQFLPFTKLTWKSLDELDAGVCDGMTYEEIEEAYPEDFANRDDDKFNYRYRGGESYRDVVLRLEPVIMELERQENILIVGHQAILRCLYAYFHNLPQDDLPYIKIPLHTVIKLTPKAYGCDEERYKVGIDAVDTHRPKPGATKSTLDAAQNTTARVFEVAPDVPVV
ncbi:probable FBP26-fructose-2,6-bisphosphatase [Serendipita indica DSM 11827]|uniref:fructose-2,6-bisphosphate 2-phosphatase n=1 Tax=Serendipita indica (strain DSM 11827) TaxID=1109443 RepID=G4U314_SERID|nr:probable FBP26-fructose-2,6-bisphosphatase [Serendipita indica DSM 11827]